MTTQATVAPVRKSVTVNRWVEDAFRLFTAEMETWWPLRSHSLGEESAATVVFEAREGGRVYERKTDGSITYWAEVLAWEPPRRFVLAWQPNPESPAATELEVTFTPEGDRTRVDLEHRGWERLGAAADLKRAEYDTGWDGVLALYGRASRSNGLAIASLVLGVASLIPFVGLLFAPFAIVLGVVGLVRARRGAPHSGLAIAGLVLGVVGLVTWLFLIGWGMVWTTDSAIVDDGPVLPPEETPAP
jgi:uncharacterized protein YndB with AHSA1/START domain